MATDAVSLRQVRSADARERTSRRGSEPAGAPSNLRRVTYQTPKTIGEVVRLIERRAYVLPAIQREFVWDREQIEELFDSLLREYPIGAFLFWEVAKPLQSGYEFYDFVADYHPKSPHNLPANLSNAESVISILDGQQRLTALNIALRGTYTEKIPRLRWNNPAAWVKKRLRLCLLHADEDASPDDQMYEFRFKSDDEALADNKDGSHFWLTLSDVLSWNPATLDHEEPLKKAGIDSNAIARTNAFRISQLIHRYPVVSYYLEQENNLDKVLNIFIRVNRGGTQLSYSDLLMSVATAKWKERDAREEVNQLVDELNAVGEGFSFKRDRVLKASLVLADRTDIKLKAANMLESMLEIEQQWDRIRRATLLAARLLASFGLSRDSLTAENVLIPVAYYAAHRNLDDNYLTAPKTREDRESIRSWVVRSLLRAGFWTGAVDTILIEARRAVRDSSGAFPVVDLETALEARGKSLRFTDGEIDDLLRVSYQRPRCVPLLTLLYPDVVRRHAFHIDHVFPRGKVRRRDVERALVAAGRPDADATDWLRRLNELPNLQLLTASENTAKGDLMPLTWAMTQLEAATRELRLAEGDLEPLPEELSDFFLWFESRRAAQEARLRKLLGIGSEE